MPITNPPIAYTFVDTFVPTRIYKYADLEIDSFQQQSLIEIAEFNPVFGIAKQQPTQTYALKELSIEFYFHWDYIVPRERLALLAFMVGKTHDIYYGDSTSPLDYISTYFLRGFQTTYTLRLEGRPMIATAKASFKEDLG